MSRRQPPTATPRPHRWRAVPAFQAPPGTFLADRFLSSPRLRVRCWRKEHDNPDARFEAWQRRDKSSRPVQLEFTESRTLYSGRARWFVQTPLCFIDTAKIKSTSRQPFHRRYHRLVERQAS